MRWPRILVPITVSILFLAQLSAISPALEGRDLVATAQTGTGKTLDFVLPIIHLIAKQTSRSGVRAVILSPTRELAIQINETFAKMAVGTGIRATVVVGGLNERTQLQSIRKGAHVLIATPGRLYDFLSRRLVDLVGGGDVQRPAMLVSAGDHAVEQLLPGHRVLDGLELAAEAEPHRAFQPHATELSGGPGHDEER